MSAADGRLHAATSSERGGRRCKSCHPDHFWKAGRYKLAAPVLKTGSAHTEVGALPTPSAILAVCQHLTATPQRKGILCDLLSVTKASCSIAKVTNQVVPFESDRQLSRALVFVRF